MQIDPKKVLSKLQITKLQKESDKLLEQYNQQNAVAAKKAIAAKDWAVLKVALIPDETISNFWLRTFFSLGLKIVLVRRVNCMIYHISRSSLN